MVAQSALYLSERRGNAVKAYGGMGAVTLKPQRAETASGISEVESSEPRPLASCSGLCSCSGRRLGLQAGNLHGCFLITPGCTCCRDLASPRVEAGFEVYRRSLIL